jgi:hypothetical protein
MKLQQLSSSPCVSHQDILNFDRFPQSATAGFDETLLPLPMEWVKTRHRQPCHCPASTRTLREVQFVPKVDIALGWKGPPTEAACDHFSLYRSFSSKNSMILVPAEILAL